MKRNDPNGLHLNQLNMLQSKLSEIPEQSNTVVFKSSVSGPGSRPGSNEGSSSSRPNFQSSLIFENSKRFDEEELSNPPQQAFADLTQQVKQVEEKIEQRDGTFQNLEKVIHARVDKLNHTIDDRIQDHEKNMKNLSSKLSSSVQALEYELGRKVDEKVDGKTSNLLKEISRIQEDLILQQRKNSKRCKRKVETRSKE